jgi:hypothetical protein
LIRQYDFWRINFGRKILRIWMKAAGSGAFSLEAYLEQLKDFSPPRGGFDPEGAWEHIYDVYPIYGKWGQHSEEHKGKCRIKREIAGDDDSFRMEVSSEVTYLDYGHGIHPTRSQLTTARIRCKSDSLCTLQSWELESVALGGDGEARPLSQMGETGVFTDGTIKLTSPGVKTPEICVSGDLTSNWSLFDAVQRLGGKGAPSGSFTMLEDLRLVRGEQRLSFDGEAEFELGDKKMRLFGYHQIGEGILPIHYWLDEGGRVLFALGGVRVYFWHSG